MRAAILFALFFAGVEAEQPKVLISTDLLWDTKDFIYDIYDAAWSNFAAEHYAKHSKTAKAALTDVLTEDPVKQACDKLGLNKADIMAKYTQAQDAVLQAKAVVTETVSQVRGPVNAIAARGVDQFEKVMPAYAGMIPKTAEDVALVAIYFLVVFYISLKVALFVLRLAFGIFCCVCCCGCCRGGKRDHGHHGHQGKHHARHNHDEAAKAKAAPSNADAKGKAKKGGK